MDGSELDDEILKFLLTEAIMQMKQDVREINILTTDRLLPQIEAERMTLHQMWTSTPIVKVQTRKMRWKK